jgi:hypothetical protein
MSESYDNPSTDFDVVRYRSDHHPSRQHCDIRGRSQRWLSAIFVQSAWYERLDIVEYGKFNNPANDNWHGYLFDNGY